MSTDKGVKATVLLSETMADAGCRRLSRVEERSMLTRGSNVSRSSLRRSPRATTTEAACGEMPGQGGLAGSCGTTQADDQGGTHENLLSLDFRSLRVMGPQASSSSARPAMRCREFRPWLSGLKLAPVCRRAETRIAVTTSS